MSPEGSPDEGLGLEPLAEGPGRRLQEPDIPADRHVRHPHLEIASGILLDRGQDADGLAAQTGRRDDPRDHLLDLGVVWLAEVTVPGREIPRPDEEGLDAINPDYRVHVGDAKGALDLHGDADVLVDPGEVLRRGA